MNARVLIAGVGTIFSASMLSLATPATAQSGEKILIVYGNDPCPTSNGEEIVVCARKPEGERYRIPEELRESSKNAPPATWAQRAQNLEYVGRGGTNSCSPDGTGGWTGCWSKLMRDARAERKAKKAEEPVLP